VTAVITTFRQAIATGLATALSIEFVPGKLDGPQRQRDLGCTFPDVIAEISGRVQEETLVVKARVFKQAHIQVAPERPIDPTELETVAAAIQTWAATHQTSIGPWFMRVVSIQFDIAQWGLEAVFVGTSANDGL
jgi:hypothetical protein